MEKTVMEWLGEVKLYNKKIEKKEKELNSTDLYCADTAIRYDKEKAKKHLEEVNALYQSYKQLVKNRNRIRQAILEFNVTTTITVGESSFTIAEALEKLKKSDDFIIDLLENNLSLLVEKEEELKYVQENEVKELEKIIYGSNKSLGSTAISEKLIERREAYRPVIEEAFDLKAELEKEKELREEFYQGINTQLNIANVKHTLDIVLD